MSFYSLQAPPRRSLRGLGAAPLYSLANPDEAPDLPTTFEVGFPTKFGVMYAKNPLVWALIFFGTGWLGGYITWVYLGKTWGSGRKRAY